MPLSTDLLNRFVNSLVSVPITDTHQGRTSLLNSFQASSLNRNENNKWADLVGIIKALDSMGQSKRTAELPLIVVVDMALASLGGLENDITTALQIVKKDLQLYYTEKKAGQADVSSLHTGKAWDNGQLPLPALPAYYTIMPLNTALNICVAPTTIPIPNGYQYLGQIGSSSTEHFYRERDEHMAVLIPQSPYAVPFLMDKYEITNQQFCLFLNTLMQEHLAHMSVTPREVAIKYAPTGTVLAIDASVYWENTKRTLLPQRPWGMEFYQGRWRSCANSELLPATLVSWWGALFYSQWVHHIPFSLEGVLHLPDQRQWTAAALFDPVAQQTRTYPWGDVWHRQKVNYVENLTHQDMLPQEDLDTWLHDHAESIKHIQPLSVGLLAEGCSPTGCHHMLGNVWEWLADADNRLIERRVIKGGSCLLPKSYCQPTYAGVWKAGNPNEYIGFRCMCPLKG